VLFGPLLKKPVDFEAFGSLLIFPLHLTAAHLSGYIYKVVYIKFVRYCTRNNKLVNYLREYMKAVVSCLFKVIVLQITTCRTVWRWQSFPLDTEVAFF